MTDTSDLRADDSTSNQELLALIDKWRYSQENQTLPRSGLTNEGEIYKQCADELESVIKK